MSVKRKEPGFRGIPRRIIRGQILKLLYIKSRTNSSLRTSLSVKLSEKELAGILELMKNDGLIRVAKVGSSARISIAG